MSSIFEWLLDMKKGTLDNGQWRLGFTSEYSNPITLGLLAVMIFMIWLTVHCYRREGTISKRIKGFLAGLRIAVICLVMLALFQPAVVLKITNVLYSNVVNVFDNSQSMLSKDKYTVDGNMTDFGKSIEKKFKLGEKNRLETLARGELCKMSVMQARPVFAKLSNIHEMEFIRFSGDTVTGQYTASMGPGVPVGGIATEQMQRKAQLKAADKLKFAQEMDSCLDLFVSKKLATKFQRMQASEIFNIWLIFEPVQARQLLAKFKAASKKYSAYDFTTKEAKTPVAPKPAEGADPKKESAIAAKPISPLNAAKSVVTDLLAEINNPPITPGDMEMMLATLDFKGQKTDLAAAFAETFRRTKGKRLGALVVYTDGQDTEENAIKRIRTALKSAGEQQANVPVYVVMVGDTNPPKNIIVSTLKIPKQIRSGMETVVEVDIKNRNYGGRPGDAGKGVVTLYRKKASEKWPADLDQSNVVEKVCSKEFKFVGDLADRSSGAKMQTVVMRFTPKEKEVGEFEYRAVVKPRNGELRKDDNYAQAPVSITDKKLKILLVSADGGWEFQYLRNYLLRQPDLFSLSVWQQNADKEVSQMASSGFKLEKLPNRIDQLINRNTKKDKKDKSTDSVMSKKVKDLPPGFDLIILYDPEPKFGGFDENFVNMLYRYVDEFGGGLCFIASGQNTMELMRDVIVNDKNVNGLAHLLPVVVDQKDVNELEIGSTAKVRDYLVGLTREGRDHQITKIMQKSNANRKAWKEVEGVYWVQDVSAIKPGARVLAYNTNPVKSLTKNKRVRQPVIATQTVGHGRVVYMGTDETWRWRHYEDGMFYRRFWNNVIRYLAPLNISQITISTGEDKFSAGDKIKVNVEAYDKNFSPIKTPTFDVKLVDMKTGKVRTVYKVKRVKGRPGYYSGEFLVNSIGRYKLTVDEKLAPRDRIASKVVDFEMPQAESRKYEANEEILTKALKDKEKRVVKVLQITELDKLTKLIPDGRRPVTEEKSFTIWDTKFMLILAVLLLAIEWFIRKRVNMA